MSSSDFRIYTDDKIIKTIKYTFVKKIKLLKDNLRL